MKNRRFMVILLAFLSVCLLAGALQVWYYPLIGMLRNEPFYDRMPASYWKEQMQTWTAKQPAPQPQWLLWLRRYFFRGGGPMRPQILDGGKDAVPVLTELVKSDDLWTKVLAIRSLAHLGPDARDAVPVLITALGDQRTIDNFDEPGLTLGSDWGWWPLYEEAAVALGSIGPEAKLAVPTLISLRRPGSHDATSDAIDHALKQIDPEMAEQIGIR
jgi:HEAT repeat protein